MSAPPPVSVLLPTHNRPETLAVAIRSALAQSFGDFELLVIGDGCTDASAEVVASFGDRRVRWFDLPKAQGFGYANRNVALREARGALTAYLAHDDLWLPDHLERMVARFAVSDKPVFAYSRPLWVMPEGEVVPGLFNLRQPAVLDRFLTGKHNALPAACVVYRDDPENRVHWWNGELERQGDWELWRRVIGGAGPGAIAYEPAPTLLHFKADWRSRDAVGPRELDDWGKLFAAPGVFPAQLRFAAGEGELQQSVAWRAVEAGGEAWVAAFRGAVAEAIDTFASFGGNDQSPLYAQLAKAEARGARLRAELDRKTARIGRLLEKIERLKGAR